jgi:hypothetical protein
MFRSLDNTPVMVNFDMATVVRRAVDLDFESSDRRGPAGFIVIDGKVVHGDLESLALNMNALHLI